AIIIVGPTASGKTAMSLELASQYSTAIISADSRQCYRELNIGVAKPSQDELRQCRHYFIDSHSIHEKVDAAVFEQEALAAAQEIFRANDVAIVTGGTGLYVKVFCEGIDEMPAIDPEVKSRVETVWRNGGVNALQQWIAEIDPVFLSATKEKDNRVRLMRALEVKLSSGRSVLDFREGHKKQREFSIKKIGIDWPREILYERINRRVDEMMGAGLLEEASSLYPHKHLKALQTVGYQELFDHFDGKYSLEEAVEKIKQHTRNYAKRQLTWFRKDPEIEWL
ncbi:MAG TPA: tRNA (adenosine(37)-N6)-dimethylallyltransferase MiaA, partial [Chitinophagaceae bacterium]|nr:tRNA (adenosine(37)-N6)-dimethylallyltransferase MiaA [Chitinophagaceae bacterium]